MSEKHPVAKGWGCLIAALAASVVGWWIIIGTLIWAWQQIERICT